MRLAYIVGTYPAVSHTFIAREVEGLRELGVEVQTFSVRRPGADQLLSEDDRRRAAETPSIQPPDWGVLVSSHLRAVCTNPRGWRQTLRLALGLSPGGVRATLWQLFYFAEAIIVWEWCRKRAIHHLHAHFADSGCWIAMLAAAYGGEALSFSFTMHGPTEFDDVHTYRLAEKVDRAALVVCISDYCRSQLMRLSPTEDWPKLELVHCGIDLSVYRPGGDGPGVPGAGPLRILCVGRLVPAKGQRVLLTALARLRASGVEARLEFVGDGPDRDGLTRAAAAAGLTESVVFHGSRPPASVREHLRRCDVLCLASFAEGLPIVLIEAMAMEVPVVSTRVMGIPELVEDGVNGLLVAPGRPAELAEALSRLARDPDLRARLGSAGRTTIVEGFDLAQQVGRLRELFEAVISDR